MHPTCCLEFWRVYTHTCVCIYHFGSSHFGSSHFGSRRFGSRGLKRVPPWVPGRPGTPMEPALLTLSGVEVAGATDGAFVSLSVASWLRLGGEVALARNSRRGRGPCRLLGRSGSLPSRARLCPLLRALQQLLRLLGAGCAAFPFPLPLTSCAPASSPSFPRRPSALPLSRLAT